MNSGKPHSISDGKNSTTGKRKTTSTSSNNSGAEIGLTPPPSAGEAIVREEVDSSSDSETANRERKKIKSTRGESSDTMAKNRVKSSMKIPTRKNESICWQHMTRNASESIGDEKKANCNYCNALLVHTTTPSTLCKHLKICHASPLNPKNSSLSKPPKDDGTSSLTSALYPKFDQAASRKQMVRMFVVGELSFNFVENDEFRKFCHKLQPRFELISRRTLVRDIYGMYEDEKKILSGFMSRACNRICLTTDTWTSNQNFSYLSLTAHFVDDNEWKLHKKIIGFIQISQHTGESMCRVIVDCLKQWNIKKVLTVTVDNASANTVLLAQLKKCFLNWDPLALMDGKCYHLRCCAHILNLIMSDGLKDVDAHIKRIRAAVKYVRGSPARYDRFKGCALAANVKSQRKPCMDVETRWNSTYLMLEAAIQYQAAFERLERLEDVNYIAELSQGVGVPTEEDWQYARNMLPFLRAFYDATNRLSGSSYITSNCYLIEVAKIGMLIGFKLNDNDGGIKDMAVKMKRKFDKYWADHTKINMLLMLALVLDPWQKMDGASKVFRGLFGYDETKHRDLMNHVHASLKSVFEKYKKMITEAERQRTPTPTPGPSVPVPPSSFDVNDIDALFWSSTGNTVRVDPVAELTKYLKEDQEAYDARKPNRDVLNWWKVNSSRFPILAVMARDLLAMPVSTVASESAFSTGGRVIDDYRSRLTPTLVQTLICTQDWLRGFSPNMLQLSPEDIEELEKLEQEFIKETPDVISCL